VSPGASSDRAKGIAFFLAAWAVVPAGDACAKLLANQGYPVLMIVWARFGFSLLMLLPLLATRHRGAFRMPEHVAMQITRVAFLIAATFGFYMGLRTLPMADALAIYFVYPFLITALAPLVLGETPGLRRWLAIVVGFAGSLLVIRPGFGAMPPGTGFVLFAAAAFAGYNLLTRRIAGRDGSWRILVFQAGAGAVILMPLLLFQWRTPDAGGLMLFLGLGATATFGHYLLIRAYSYAPAPVLAPFGYFEIVFATALGFAIFGDFPDALTWAGVAVIVLSGIYIGVRERRNKIY